MSTVRRPPLAAAPPSAQILTTLHRPPLARHSPPHHHRTLHLDAAAGLAQSRVLADPAFAAYLRYLLYWRRPEYARFIVYPHALALLELLQAPEFREAVASPGYKELLHSQQFFAWQHYAKARRHEAAAERGEGGDGGGGEGAAAGG
jgi:hypothetical protein